MLFAGFNNRYNHIFSIADPVNIDDYGFLGYFSTVTIFVGEKSGLISIVFRFIWSLLGDTNIVCLFFSELGEINANLFQV